MMTFANKITLFRIITIPFFVASLIFYSPQKEYLKYVALAIFLLAIVSDIIDGYIARTQRQKTRAGAILDPLADKALLLSAFIFIFHVSKVYFAYPLPLWLLLVVISRDIIILVGCGIILSTQHDTQIVPTRWGKLTTFFQMMTIVCIILELSISPIVWWCAAFFSVISGIDYARRGINMLNASDHNSNYAKNNRRALN